MATVASDEPCPVEGVATGQLVPPLPQFAGLVPVLAVLVGFILVAAPVLVPIAVTTGDTTELSLLLSIVLFGVAWSGALVRMYLCTRRTALVARIGPDGAEVTAGEYTQRLPWSRIAGWWFACSGWPVPALCLLPDDPSWFRPPGAWWRLKLLVNRRSYGTPIAVPLDQHRTQRAGPAGPATPLRG